MADYLLIQRRLDKSGPHPRVLAIRLSFARLPGEDWNVMGRLQWTGWAPVGLLLEGAKSREMIEVNPQTLPKILGEQIDLIRCVEAEKENFDAIVRQATAKRRKT